MRGDRTEIVGGAQNWGGGGGGEVCNFFQNRLHLLPTDSTALPINL